MTTALLKAGQECSQIIKETARVYWTLVKVMVPTLIAVKLLDMIGGTEALAYLLSPVMQLLGLPDAIALVWAATLLTNIYTGMMVFFNLALEQPLSVAQVSVLGILMLLAHSLPIEGAVARSAGVGWRATLSIRIGGALVLGALTNLIYSHFELLQTPSTLLWRPEGSLDTSLAEWALNQAETLLLIFPIILTLLALLRLLQLLGIERLIHYLLFPVLRLLGIGKAAANVTVIGTVLGLTFGAGLLIREARSGRISQRDIFLTLSFLGLCHSLIEDTLLIMLLGADLSAILWARLAFAILAIAILARLAFVQRKPDTAPTTDQA
ncbi:hypothetical protein KQ940_14090 [Marinobacterium sp. D7]|uniref:hypothetical protein n=1 Tax=Marinobacterium ramblicola TaxID=2849041 RepID=UPI001C2CE19C|nr:hypothetical protein [Marinobacterium ramblicola]MBV1789184.1 hypothetical protein [Marinobacterium ramblicola]